MPTASPTSADRSRLVFSGLAPFYARVEPVGYALVRVWLGLTILTHGVPKLLRLPHGGSPDAYANLVQVIGGKLHLPGAGALAMLVTFVETLGALLLVLGLGTRVVAATLAVELLVVSLGVHWPKWEWTEGGMEYPLLMAAVAGYLALRGGGAFSIDARLRRQV